MSERIAGHPINWYWIPVDRKVLVQLSRKSDLLGALQTLGFLGILACTGCAAYYSGSHWAWYATAGLLFLHGSCRAFLSNALHEFSHGTVFSTRVLNRALLCLVSFLSWNNPTLFWASHTEHHKFTLCETDDQEVSAHASPTLRGYLQIAFVNPAGLLRSLGMTFRHAFGKIDGEWEEKLFPPAAAEKRRSLLRWAWMLPADIVHSLRYPYISTCGCSPSWLRLPRSTDAASSGYVTSCTHGAVGQCSGLPPMQPHDIPRADGKSILPTSTRLCCLHADRVGRRRGPDKRSPEPWVIGLGSANKHTLFHDLRSSNTREPGNAFPHAAHH